MATIATLAVALTARTTKFERGMRRAGKTLRRFSYKMRNLGKDMMFLGVAVVGPMAIAAKAAGDAMETLNKFEQVFGTQAKAAGEFADALASSVGRSKYAIRDSLSSFQAFFVGLGFGGEQGREMSEVLEELTLDFASLYNIQDPEALAKFQSGLAGMSRPLREYGINLLESAVKAEALVLGLGKAGSELTQQQKVLARLSIIIKTMTKQGAVGDAIRTAAAFNNQLKATGGALRDFAAAIGKSLLPPLASMLARMRTLIELIGGSAERFPRLIRLTFGFGAGLLAVGAAMWGLSKAAALMAALLSPTVLWIGAIAGAVLLADKLGLIDVNWRTLVGNFTTGMETLVTLFSVGTGGIKALWLDMVDSMHIAWLKFTGMIVGAIVKPLQVVYDALDKMIEMIDLPKPEWLDAMFEVDLKGFVKENEQAIAKIELARQERWRSLLEEQPELGQMVAEIGKAGVVNFKALEDSAGNVADIVARIQESLKAGVASVATIKLPAAAERGSREAYSAIVGARYSAQRNRPQEQTAKNTGQTVKEVQETNRLLREAQAPQLAIANIVP